MKGHDFSVKYGGINSDMESVTMQLEKLETLWRLKHEYKVRQAAKEREENDLETRISQGKAATGLSLQEVLPAPGSRLSSGR